MSGRDAARAIVAAWRERFGLTIDEPEQVVDIIDTLHEPESVIYAECLEMVRQLTERDGDDFARWIANEQPSLPEASTERIWWLLDGRLNDAN